jgi:hypothetical protein
MISKHAKMPGVMENMNPAHGIRPFLVKKVFPDFDRGDLSAHIFLCDLYSPAPPKKVP